jgi:hypothetical protein
MERSSIGTLTLACLLSTQIPSKKSRSRPALLSTTTMTTPVLPSLPPAAPLATHVRRNAYSAPANVVPRPHLSPDFAQKQSRLPPPPRRPIHPHRPQALPHSTLPRRPSQVMRRRLARAKGSIRARKKRDSPDYRFTSRGVIRLYQVTFTSNHQARLPPWAPPPPQRRAGREDRRETKLSRIASSLS